MNVLKVCPNALERAPRFDPPSAAMQHREWRDALAAQLPGAWEGAIIELHEGSGSGAPWEVFAVEDARTEVVHVLPDAVDRPQRSIEPWPRVLVVSADRGTVEYFQASIFHDRLRNALESEARVFHHPGCTRRGLVERLAIVRPHFLVVAAHGHRDGTVELQDDAGGAVTRDELASWIGHGASWGLRCVLWAVCWSDLGAASLARECVRRGVPVTVGCRGAPMDLDLAVGYGAFLDRLLQGAEPWDAMRATRVAIRGRSGAGPSSEATALTLRLVLTASRAPTSDGAREHAQAPTRRGRTQRIARARKAAATRSTDRGQRGARAQPPTEVSVDEIVSTVVAVLGFESDLLRLEVGDGLREEQQLEALRQDFAEIFTSGLLDITFGGECRIVPGPGVIVRGQRLFWTCDPKDGTDARIKVDLSRHDEGVKIRALYLDSRPVLCDLDPGVYDAGAMIKVANALQIWRWRFTVIDPPEDSPLRGSLARVEGGRPSVDDLVALLNARVWDPVIHHALSVDGVTEEHVLLGRVALHRQLRALGEQPAMRNTLAGVVGSFINALHERGWPIRLP